ncbi:MAG: phosphoribosylanthranilate isomerase [Oleispira antarctica]|uniref:N-(5'-phosphoribosyl)anthranilate isomerase n=1 Tax=Oleispira antarctica RB-8 TaxID=698738 RepID=R4YM90_OLEAN|nr:phosphoribosylanthranilate isomerase [Oleispira antarctica]MBQ0791174.1 phosphoribosylanthranilate isomerase [Oleispira antarctica]CCK76021.1 N-(5\'-phosphoribosyl)anthranilate isomerase [Oleispira antarctica RB-8]
MSKVRIKICGLTRNQDVQVAVAEGADALGFVLYAPSPRAVTAEQAALLIKDSPAFVTTVALFVNESAEEIVRALTVCSFDLLQFHGDETPQFCRQFNRPYMKAIRVRSAEDIHRAVQQYPDAKALLLDAYVENLPGGTGQAFDWRLIPELSIPWVLAGGLNANNVADAVNQVQPFAVDVSGGVEASKGIKDRQKIKDFISEVRNVER